MKPRGTRSFRKNCVPLVKPSDWWRISTLPYLEMRPLETTNKRCPRGRICVQLDIYMMSQTFIALNEPEYRRITITDVKTSKMSYTMLNSSEEQKLATFEEIVVRFVSKVLGGTDQPIWAGGTASEGRRIRLVVPGLMPPVILELLPSDIPDLTPKSLMESLNAQICRQRK